MSGELRKGEIEWNRIVLLLVDVWLPPENSSESCWRCSSRGSRRLDRRECVHSAGGSRRGPSDFVWSAGSRSVPSPSRGQK